jgi:hypothetical protein
MLDTAGYPDYPIGTEFLDCGQRVTITDKEEDIDVDGERQNVYTVEFEDGKTFRYPAEEIELGFVDGTIRGVAK